jgi:lysophospholipase L1-like esterase
VIKKRFLFSLLFLVSFLLFVAFVDKKPKILIIGDSISIGYTPFVKEYFSKKAIVSRNKGNAQHTGTGLEKMATWLGEEQWDIVQINWGLWDLCYRHPDSKEYGNRDKINGKPEYTIQEYASNLDTIVSIIKKKTNAKLIFVTTTYVPENEPGRYQSEVQKYNEAAKIIMKKHGVLVNDIYKASIPIHKSFGLGTNDVHYNKEGYEKLGKLITDFLEKQL